MYRYVHKPPAALCTLATIPNSWNSLSRQVLRAPRYLSLCAWAANGKRHTYQGCTNLAGSGTACLPYYHRSRYSKSFCISALVYTWVEGGLETSIVSGLTKPC
ncbi:hypothetical protein HD806DRAFT_385289 [Xylariaceae sp. AK1471]|nr:hypothetical protein HD806DRAFT_385289 [Xylariaceae sp. AK1471]